MLLMHLIRRHLTFNVPAVVCTTPHVIYVYAICAALSVNYIVNVLRQNPIS